MFYIQLLFLIFSFYFISPSFAVPDAEGEPSAKRRCVRPDDTRVESSSSSSTHSSREPTAYIREVQEDFRGFLSLIADIEYLYHHPNWIQYSSLSPSSPGQEALSSQEKEDSPSHTSSQGMSSSESEDDNLYSMGHVQRFPEGSSVHHLNSLQDHRRFVEYAFQRAQQQIIFCSPFINLSSGFRKDFTNERILNALQRGVEVTFIVSGQYRNLGHFKKYLGPIMDHQKFHLIQLDNFHFKTAIIDDFIIVEGSFNWLSAYRDPKSRYCNAESSLMLQGPVARPMISQFLTSMNKAQNKP